MSVPRSSHWPPTLDVAKAAIPGGISWPGNAPLMAITWTAGKRPRTSKRNSKPDIPGILRSGENDVWDFLPNLKQ